MNKLCKIFWLLFSYAPLYFICSIVCIIEGVVRQKSWLWITGICLLVLTIVSIIGCIVLIKIAKGNIPPIKYKIIEASTKDSEMLANTLAYLIPMITLTLDSVNYWMLIGLVFIIIVLTTMTRAVILNPVLYLFKYRYYTIKADSGMCYTLITRKKRLDPSEIGNLIEIFDEIYIEV